MKKRTIIPLLLTGIIVSCGTKKPLERVRISNPNMEKRANRIDTASVPQIIKWTDDKGKTRIITRSEHDSISGEDITTVQLSEITVTAQSKQVAERNGKVNLDFLVTVPGSLINNKWQLQLTPVAYKPNDTLYLDKIFLSGADFAKMQKKDTFSIRLSLPPSFRIVFTFTKCSTRRDIKRQWQNWRMSISRHGSMK